MRHPNEIGTAKNSIFGLGVSSPVPQDTPVILEREGNDDPVTDAFSTILFVLSPIFPIDLLAVGERKILFRGILLKGIDTADNNFHDKILPGFTLRIGILVKSLNSSPVHLLGLNQ